MSGSNVKLARPLFGVDYCTRIPPNILHAHGVHFVCRYISRSSWKAITRWEANELTAAGINIALVFEDGARNAWLGYAQGVYDAEFAYNAARAAGMPAHRPIFFAVDSDTAGNPGATDGYFDGVAHVLGHGQSGPYGGIEVVERQHARGFQYCWQTLAWSYGHISTHARIYQSAINRYMSGYGIDPDVAYFEDYGQWGFKPKEDPYAIFLDRPVRIGRQRINERLLVMQTDGALKHPVKYHDYLLGRLRPRLKLDRDRIRHEATKSRPHTWDKYHRGLRWQGLNNRIKRIDKLPRR